MLYDKRWDKEQVTRDPLSLEAFAEWLEKQPADKEYDYSHPRQCAICQYLDHLGIKYRGVNPFRWRDVNKVEHLLPQHWNDVAFRGRETFGAAAARARKILANRSQ